MRQEDKKICLAVEGQPLRHSELTGIGRVTQQLLKGLCESNRFSIAVQGTTVSAGSRQALKQNLPFMSEKQIYFYRLPAKPMYIAYSLLPFLYSSLFGKSDIFISFNYFLPVGVHGKKVIMIHDMTMKRYPETMKPLMRYALDATIRSNCRRADRILTVSEFSKREICELLDVSADKVQVIPLAIDKSQFHCNYPQDGIENLCSKLGIQGPYFLYVGTLEPRKNIVRLVEAYALLRGRLKESPKLVICGKKGWLYDEIFSEIKDLGISDHVIFTGFVSDEDLPLLMSGARAFVFPSIYEGFGLPPLEAMACGTPVLSANVASLPEVIGDAGILVDPFDVESIAQGMYDLATDDVLFKSMKERGIERAKSFDWSNGVDALLKNLEDLSC